MTLCVDRVATLSVRLVSGISVIQLFVALEETAGRAAILTVISLSERPFSRLNCPFRRIDRGFGFGSTIGF